MSRLRTGNSFYVSNQKIFTIFWFLFIFLFDVLDKLWVLIQPVPEVSLILICSSDMWQLTKTIHADNVYCPAGTRLIY